jgi:4-hydroxy-3-methylbut-2-en-1-yl diphosphate reductase
VNRTLLYQRFKVAGPGPEEVLVATEFDHPERGPVRCPAAPVVAGWLRRRGLRVRSGPVSAVSRYLPGTRLPGGAVLFAASYLDREGRAVGIGAAAAVVSPGPAAAALNAVRTCGSVMRTRRVVMAATDPSCSGEGAALAQVRAALAAVTGPVYVYGQLIRNHYVADDLRRQGAIFAGSLDEIPDDSTIVFPAHGVPLSVRAEAAARSMRIIDATCPLVIAAHETARSYADRGDTIALIGRPGHAALAGISGQAPEGTRVISTAAEAMALDVEAPDRLSYLVQTGIPVEHAAPVVAALRSRFPAMRGPHPDQFCYAASDRLGAIRRVAEVSDVLIVAGAADCADSRQALETAAATGAQAHLVEMAGDIRPDWLGGASTVGLTTGLGAAPELTDEVLTILSGLGPLGVARTILRTDLRKMPTPATATGLRHPHGLEH